jgi:hypothetical protein
MQELALPGKSTKGVIIEVLNREFPLSAKQIYNQFKKRAISITYHSVYDMIQEMVVKGIVVKEEKEYRLDGKWVMETCVTMERIRVRQVLGPINKLSEKSDNTHLVTFKNYDEFSKFIRNYFSFFVDNCDKKNDNTIYWITDHMLVGGMYLEKKAEMFTRMKDKNIKHRSIITGNTPMDNFVRMLYHNVGIEDMKTGVKNNFGMNIGIFNDVAIIIMRPPEIKNKIEKIYNHTIGMGEKFSKLSEAFAKLSKLLEEEFQTQILVTKNPIMIDTYKKYIEKQFTDQKTD